MAIASTSMSRRNIDDEKRLELTEHLDELRQRIIRALLYVTAASIGCYYIFRPLYAFLFRPLEASLKGHADYRIVFNHIPDAFFVTLEICIVSGFIIAAPFVIAEAWGFIAPALTRDEKKPLRFIAPLSIVLFVAGVALAYWVSKYAFGWFIGYVELFPRAVLYQDPKAYLIFMLKMMGIFGLVFQLPVALAFLAWVGILKSSAMKRTWRHATLGISVIGLVITPSNDIFTMLMMTIPVVLLYLGSIWLVQFIERKRHAR